MDKIEVTILDPQAEAILDDMANKKLIKLKKPKARREKSESKLSDERLAFYLSAPVMSDEEYENYKQTREWMNRWRTK